MRITYAQTDLDVSDDFGLAEPCAQKIDSYLQWRVCKFQIYVTLYFLFAFSPLQFTCVTGGNF